MENIEKVYLENATRNQLIEELNRRDSVTSIQINHGEGATIKTSFGIISIEGKSNVFVIKENITNKNGDVSLNETGNFLTTIGEEIIIS